MRSTQQFSVTIPKEMAEMIRRKVESGEYASESEVFRDGLRALLARERALEAWLRNVGAPAFDALKAAPSRGIPAEQVRAELEAKAARRRSKKG